jgi:prolyl-tRNA editing enzyme YbaK/EbsC (Cys-tRNA(Pro) deacylase)
VEAIMAIELSASAKRIQDALLSLGASFEVVELPQSTRTAVEAASAIGCSVEQIAKSIVFRTKRGRVPILVIASGVNRVNEARIAALTGEPVEKADAAYVRERTGFAIGGIPPIGHIEPIHTFVDEDLMAFSEIWAAAGTPNAVFRLDPKGLIAITGGTLASIK